MDISTGWPSLISTHGYIHGYIHGYPYPRQPCIGYLPEDWIFIHLHVTISGTKTSVQIFQ